MNSIATPVCVRRTTKGKQLAALPVWIREWQRHKRLVFSLTDTPRSIRAIHTLVPHIQEQRIHELIVELVAEGYVEAQHE